MVAIGEHPAEDPQLLQPLLDGAPAAQTRRSVYLSLHAASVEVQVSKNRILSTVPVVHDSRVKSIVILGGEHRENRGLERWLSWSPCSDRAVK